MYDAYLYRILTHEQIEGWLREAEQRRAASIAVAYRAAHRARAAHVADDRPAPRTAWMLSWARWGTQLASSLRLW